MCVEGTAPCPDGLCAPWCAPHEGCPLRAPLRCPDGSCHEEDAGGEGGSLGLAACRGGCAQGEVRCYDGGCVAEAQAGTACVAAPWEQPAVAVRA